MFAQAVGALPQRVQEALPGCLVVPIKLHAPRSRWQSAADWLQTKRAMGQNAAKPSPTRRASCEVLSEAGAPRAPGSL